MTHRPVLFILGATFLFSACSNRPNDTGPVTISIQQSLTGQASAAGSFQMTGSVSDTGQTTEELTFLGPLDKSPVPVPLRAA